MSGGPRRYSPTRRSRRYRSVRELSWDSEKASIRRCTQQRPKRCADPKCARPRSSAFRAKDASATSFYAPAASMPGRPASTPAQMKLGRRARHCTSVLGLSQMKLADNVGLHFAFLSDVECGERNRSRSILLRLAERLDVDPGHLACGLSWSK